LIVVYQYIVYKVVVVVVACLETLVLQYHSIS
jgi:hypothetical protein